MSQARTVFSASEASYSAAAKELRGVFGGALVERLGPDVGCLHAAGVDIADIADIAEECRRRPLVFVRHLMREEARVSAEASDAGNLISGAAIDLARSHAIASELALQIWVSGDATVGPRADELRSRVADGLQRQGFAVARADRAWVLSICATPTGIVLGINRRADALADWPGGRVRLARDEGQVSRSEFKLEEALAVFDLALPVGGVAMDLGASPGGWTRVLRRHGLSVWAVDPADLDLRVVADPSVHHARTTAGRFLAETDRSFDLVVNDMRMTAELSCEVMLVAARRLKPGGLAIVTLKLSPHEPLQTVHTSLTILRRAYVILHARQLHHNRNEVTVVARRG